MFAVLETFVHTPWMLAGLALVTIPPIIHLLNRRRHDVIDWGAMQFLQVSEVVRRRMLLEEVLLMLLRMGLVGVLVFALAGPFLDVALPAGFGSYPSRDVVLVVDGSASMSAGDELGGPTPTDKAREWARAYLAELSPGDTAALLVAREQVEPVVSSLSSDLPGLRERLDRPITCSGTANWPEAIEQAHKVLEASQKTRREIVLLGDAQKFGWADPDTLFRWELLKGKLGLDRPLDPSRGTPVVYAVNLAPDRSETPPNYGLAPLTGNRPVVSVDREVTLRSELLLTGQQNYSPPYKLRLEIDGKAVRDLQPPGTSGMPIPREGRVPFSFSHRFQKPGSHLVSVILEPDPPPEDRPAGYIIKDRVPGDNRQDFAIEVVKSLPVLLVDGTPSVPTFGYLGTDFLRDALSPARDRQPAVQARVVRIEGFTPEMLKGDDRPRVCVLHDVAKLDRLQTEALATYLGEGGGVLVTLGQRADSNWYNEQLFRGGTGWLPARLDGLTREEIGTANAFRPDPATFTHPVLELFRKVAAGGLADARFPRAWKLTTPGRHSPAVIVGQLQGRSEKMPLLVEKSVGAGRVFLCAVPLDNSLGANLVDLPAFVPLAHELIYYLAGARSAEFNLRAGQPLRLRVPSEATLEDFRLTPPSGPTLPLSEQPGASGTYPAQLLRQDTGSLLVYEGARVPGVYEIQGANTGVTYYVVPTDPREADLSTCTPADREQVSKLTGVRFEDDRDVILGGSEGATRRQEMWLYLLLGLIALLCLEVWMTRRVVMNR